MLQRSQSVLVIASLVVATLAASPVEAKCGKVCQCQKACYATYEKFIFGNPKPGQVSKHRKEYFACKKACAG